MTINAKPFHRKQNGSLCMKLMGLFAACMLHGACTSDPYVKQTTLNESLNQRTELVCTHKTALIPYYAIVVAGFFTVRYGHECSEEVSPLAEPSKYTKKTTIDKNPCPPNQVQPSNGVCESPTWVEKKVQSPELPLEQN